MRSIEELIRLKRIGEIWPDGPGRHDWTDEESAAIKRAYREGRHKEAIYALFPGEADEVESEAQE